MKPVFADTSFFVAILNDRDSLHAVAKEARDRHRAPGLTTEFILLEVANFCTRQRQRTMFATLVGNLRGAGDLEIIPASHELFERSLALFLARPDKAWSLTDCTSFTVMQERGATEALTCDHHFEQAGFSILLK